MPAFKPFTVCRKVYGGLLYGPSWMILAFHSEGLAAASVPSFCEGYDQEYGAWSLRFGLIAREKMGCLTGASSSLISGMVAEA